MKRHAALVGLSQDHHHGLVLSRRCIAGETTWDDVARVFAEELDPHFRIEERSLLPRLGEDPVVARTHADHAELRRRLDERGSLADFGRALQTHIRFEERELFERAQALLTDAELDAIGRAWPKTGERREGNLFDVEPPEAGERFDTLVRCRNVIVERIASSAATVAGEVYDQPQDEWVALLRGDAKLEVGDERVTLAAGDHVFIPAHRRHRVLETSGDALWLAVHVHASGPVETYTIERASFDEIAPLVGAVPELDAGEIDPARLDRRRHLCLVARLGGEPAGFKVGYEETPERFYSWVGGVLPAHRRRGVARRLLEAQEAWCEQNGFTEIAVKSRNRFRGMLALLVASGYDVFAVQANGAVVFRKTLGGRPPDERTNGRTNGSAST